MRLNNIAGLPPGLVVNCNSQTGAQCTYLSGSLGCGSIEGTPTAEGVYPLTINVTAFANLLGNPVPVDYPFSGYSIVIGPNTVVLVENMMTLSGVRNVPNPFMERTTIEFQLTQPGSVTIRLFDLLGAEVRSLRVAGKAGLNRYVLNAKGLQDGHYLPLQGGDRPHELHRPHGGEPLTVSIMHSRSPVLTDGAPCFHEAHAL